MRPYAAPRLVCEGPPTVRLWGLSEAVSHLGDVRDAKARARYELWILAGRLILAAYERAALTRSGPRFTPWMLERIEAT